MFSVCIPVWNEEESINRIADNVRESSLWQEPGGEKELIFCINGSTDKSESIARGIAEKDPRVKLIVLPKKGKNLAWNELVRRSRKSSDILFFVDADVLLERDTLSKLKSELEKAPAIAVAGAINRIINEETKPAELFRRRTIRLDKKLRQYPEYINGRCYAIRRVEAEKITMPSDQRIHEDALLTLFFRRRFRVVGDAEVYSHAPSLRDLQRQRMRAFASSILIRKHFPELVPGLDEMLAGWKNVMEEGQKKRAMWKRPIFGLLHGSLDALAMARARAAIGLGRDTWKKTPSTKNRPKPKTKAF